MHTKRDGYISGAYLFLPAIRKLRAHIEFEKFICRILKDDERTKQFKVKTETHKDSIHALRYNNPRANAMTAAERKKVSDAT